MSGPDRVPVEFESDGATVRGFLYPAQTGDPPFPVVVMAHGTSATITMVADRYAETFAAAGVSALLYDHRNFGISDGEPRHHINPWIQARGYRDAVGLASNLDGHDPDRIALWGDSYTGGVVFVVAACAPRVAAVVAQCPTFGSEPSAIEPSAELLDLIRATLASGDVSGLPEDMVGPLPVVSSDQAGTPSLLKPIQAYRWFIDYGARFGTGWENSVTRTVPSNCDAPYSPFLCANFVDVPSLVMVAPGDEMPHADPAVARQAFQLLRGPKRLYEIDGGHFGLVYHPSAIFDEASSVQAAFLVEHLLGHGGQTI